MPFMRTRNAESNSELKRERMRTSEGDVRKAAIRLWIVQGLLAAVFLFAGGMKLVLPMEALAQQSHLPGLFMKFIGACETLGALGLILPGLLRIKQGLTPLAAAGLMVIMAGATTLTLTGGNGAVALIPLAVGLLSTFVAYGRYRLSPQRRSIQARVLQPAN
jgi:hypothetical protein